MRILKKNSVFRVSDNEFITKEYFLYSLHLLSLCGRYVKLKKYFLLECSTVCPFNLDMFSKFCRKLS